MADGRLEAAAHFITDLDRTDAHAVRQMGDPAGPG
jgi:hypothetical protein